MIKRTYFIRIRRRLPSGNHDDFSMTYEHKSLVPNIDAAIDLAIKSVLSKTGWSGSSHLTVMAFNRV